MSNPVMYFSKISKDSGRYFRNYTDPSHSTGPKVYQLHIIKKKKKELVSYLKRRLRMKKQL